MDLQPLFSAVATHLECTDFQVDERHKAHYRQPLHLNGTTIDRLKSEVIAPFFESAGFKMSGISAPGVARFANDALGTHYIAVLTPCGGKELLFSILRHEFPREGQGG